MKYKCKNTGKIIEIENCKGLYPCNINSSLLTAQLRDRYYWSNIRTRQDGMFGDIITDIPQPKDRGILLKDIITSGEINREKFRVPVIYENKVYQINPSKESGGMQPFMQNRIYDVKGKSVALTECMAHKIKYQTEDKIVRTVNKIEMCRLQGFPDNYCDILTTAKAGSLLGDGWTLPIIEHIFNYLKQ